MTGAPLQGVTDVTLAHGPVAPASTDRLTLYRSTATVTSTIHSTHFITMTAIFITSRCPTTTATASNTVHSAASTGVYYSSSTAALPLPDPPATLSYHGTSSHLGLLESGALSFQGRASTEITRSKGIASLITVSGKGSSTFRSLHTSVPVREPSVHLPMSELTPVATGTTRAAFSSHLKLRNVAIGESGLADDDSDYTLSSGAPSVDAKHIATALENGNTQTS